MGFRQGTCTIRTRKALQSERSTGQRESSLEGSGRKKKLHQLYKMAQKSGYQLWHVYVLMESGYHLALSLKLKDETFGTIGCLRYIRHTQYMLLRLPLDGRTTT